MGVNTLKPQKDARTRQGYYEVINKEKYVGNPMIIYRSSWELKFCKQCDRESKVIKWSSEPIKIPFYHPTVMRTRNYIPDFYMEILHVDGSIRRCIIEIKPNEQRTRPKPPSGKKIKKAQIDAYNHKLKTYLINRAKFESAYAYCKNLGWDFRILDERYFGTSNFGY